MKVTFYKYGASQITSEKWKSDYNDNCQALNEIHDSGSEFHSIANTYGP